MDPLPTSGAAPCAEGLAAFALVFAGCGAIVADATHDGALGTVGVGLVFGLVIMVMVYATGHLSGAHINPAVTLAFTLDPPLPRPRGRRLRRRPAGGRHRPPPCCSAPSGRTSPADLGATRPDGRRRHARCSTRLVLTRLPDVRDHGRGHRHPSGRSGGGDRHRRGRRARRPVRRAGHRRLDEPGPLAGPGAGERASGATSGSTSPARSPGRRSGRSPTRWIRGPSPAGGRLMAKRPLRLPAQRRALADEPGAVRARGGRAATRPTRRARRRASASTPRWSR